MKKIGLYTAYDPKMDLQQHGLGRLLIFLLKGLIEIGYTPVIALPSWHIECMRKFLHENHLEKRVELFYATGTPPIALQLADVISSRKHLRLRKKFVFPGRKLFIAVGNLLSSIFYSILATNSWMVAIVCGFIFTLFLPFLLIVFLLYLIIRLILTPYPFRKAYGFIAKNTNKITDNQLKNIVTITLNKNFKALKNFTLVKKISSAYRQRELPALICKINNSDINKWIVPTIFWEESTKITRPKVTVVPDLVHLSFPLHMCGMPGIEQRIGIINRILTGCNNFITYSNFVKEQQLMKHCGIYSRCIHVVPHAGMDLASYIKPELLDKAHASLKRGAYQKLAKYDFNSFDYIIYPSQMRPYKNILSLIMACKKLITRRYCNIKLVLTANDPGPIANFIRDNNMANDVIIAPDLSDIQLAALYHSAKLAVNPTLFEGGFPFTFSEAFSAGTPSVMSGIPVTAEYVPDELADLMLFDPYNVDDMAAKIYWGLTHREELFEAQQKLYNNLMARTWKDVAGEYVAAIN